MPPKIMMRPPVKTISALCCWAIDDYRLTVARTATKSGACLRLLFFSPLLLCCHAFCRDRFFIAPLKICIQQLKVPEFTPSRAQNSIWLKTACSLALDFYRAKTGSFSGSRLPILGMIVRLRYDSTVLNRTADRQPTSIMWFLQRSQFKRVVNRTFLPSERAEALRYTYLRCTALSTRPRAYFPELQFG